MQFTKVIIENTKARKVIIILILLALIALAAPWAGQAVRLFTYQLYWQAAQFYLNYRTKNFNSLEGQGFTVKFTDRDKDIAQQTISLTERYYQEIQQLLGVTLPAEFIVVIYPDKGSLNNCFGWDMSQNPVGVYWAGSISVLSPHVWGGEPEQKAPTDLFSQENPLAHELTHLIVDHLSNGNYTRWLSEGLAQYMENMLTNYTLPEPEVKPGLVPLSQLEYSFDDPDRQLEAYWQARVMVDYLVDQFGLPKMVQYLELLGQGGSMDVAFQRIYGFSMDYVPVTVFNY